MTHTRTHSSARALQLGAAAWFICATIGQWTFVLFILLFFGGHTVSGDLAGLNQKAHVTGYVPGDAIGNFQFIAHALMGGIVTFAGTWQLIPGVRRRWPRLHRWNGRIFLGISLVAALTGLSLTWIRGSQLGPGSNLSITLNGVLILVFATLAWRTAIHRDFARHRVHALRTFLLVNGVWFLRIGIMLAGLLLAPLGVEINYRGMVFVGVSLASWILPLLMLELYLRAERSLRVAPRYAMAVTLGLLALLTLAGSLAAAAFMWLPALHPAASSF
ncbi:MAG: DUF2306 domain-containing protein [Lysobacterales bacterium]|nr:DUF2306 domain-containing protein [Xanthomonadales bacterium]MCP5474923.1 DUF2306 domain-containing protein [Rhodanobacteraceae bacterium]